MGYISFFDDWHLMSYHNLTRRLGKPRYIPEATLEDELTEGTWNFPLVVRVPETGKYIGLYGAAVSPPGLIDLSKWKGLKPRVQVLCFAESTDGIHWTKPDLSNQVVLDGPRFAPNQVFGTKLVIDGAPVYYDPYDPDPTRRFKYLINLSLGVHAPGHRALAISADGKQWRIAQEFTQLPSTDTPSSVFFNPYRQTYVLNTRKYSGDRRVFFSERRIGRPLPDRS